MSLLKSIFTKIIVFAIATMVIMPNALAVTAITNMPAAEIGDYGNWLTPENVAMFNDNISADLSEFQAESRAAQLVSDYVPIEAKVGLALMNALSRISDILDSSLVRFSIIFMIIAYAFWILFEAYNMMSKGTSAMDFGVDAVKKGAVIAIWSIVLAFGPAQIFMWVMGPIIGVAAYLSDLILNAVSNVAGFEIPDTCAAIHAYTAANISENMIMDAKTAGDLLCVPTRLSGFFATAISAGWQWLVAGIGRSAFTMLVGAIFIGVFLYNGFKFMMMGLGVVVDLFLGVMMLPFTAIAETLKKTSYSGIAGSIFNGFLGLFNTQSLADQIKRFVNAAIYFVSHSQNFGFSISFRISFLKLWCTGRCADVRLSDLVQRDARQSFLLLVLPGRSPVRASNRNLFFYSGFLRRFVLGNGKNRVFLYQKGGYANCITSYTERVL